MQERLQEASRCGVTEYDAALDLPRLVAHVRSAAMAATALHLLRLREPPRADPGAAAPTTADRAPGPDAAAADAWGGAA
jgi:hypothetical protein